MADKPNRRKEPVAAVTARHTPKTREQRREYREAVKNADDLGQTIQADLPTALEPSLPAQNSIEATAVGSGSRPRLKPESSRRPAKKGNNAWNLNTACQIVVLLGLIISAVATYNRFDVRVENLAEQQRKLSDHFEKSTDQLGELEKKIAVLEVMSKAVNATPAMLDEMTGLRQRLVEQQERAMHFADKLLILENRLDVIEKRMPTAASGPSH